MARELWQLLRKEMLLEWKQRYAFNGLLLYVLSMVVVISLAFKDQLNPLTWNITYWIMLLFTAINAVAKSFIGERSGNLLYLYGLVRPAAIILSKTLYNAVLLWVIASLSLLAFALLSEMSIARMDLMLMIAGLGSAALAVNLTLVSAIAARADNRHTLLAVLSFPVIVPVLLILIRLTRYAVEGAEGGKPLANAYDEIGLLAGMTGILLIVATILFPFVWRE